MKNPPITTQSTFHVRLFFPFKYPPWTCLVRSGACCKPTHQLSWSHPHHRSTLLDLTPSHDITCISTRPLSGWGHVIWVVSPCYVMVREANCAKLYKTIDGFEGTWDTSYQPPKLLVVSACFFSCSNPHRWFSLLDLMAITSPNLFIALNTPPSICLLIWQLSLHLSTN